MTGRKPTLPPTPEPIDGWQCIGCGRVDAPRPCIGVCQDKRVALVKAGDYVLLEARYVVLERRHEELRAFLGLISQIRPSPNGWEKSFLAMQAQARALLGSD
jgi:hypothetical protein